MGRFLGVLAALAPLGALAGPTGSPAEDCHACVGGSVGGVDAGTAWCPPPAAGGGTIGQPMHHELLAEMQGRLRAAEDASCVPEPDAPPDPEDRMGEILASNF